MLKNYIKIAFRVMLRQKFFTAISIFGISFTIMICSIVAGMTDIIFGNVAPAINRSRTLYFDGYSSYVKDNERTYTAPGPAVYNDVKKLAGVERLSMYITGRITSFTKDKKVSLDLVFSDEQIWTVYKHEFLEGKPFTAKDAAEGRSVAVITESAKRYYFGKGNAIGKYLETTPRLMVIGVIKDFINVHGVGPEGATIFVPLMRYHTLSGKAPTFSAVIVSHHKSDIPNIKKGIHELIRKKYNPSGGDVYVNAQDIYEKIDLKEFLTLMGALLFFTIVIPALNLVGLNINRISERSSEIGIRKAFGASSSILGGQFIIENIIITCIGGSVGILMTYAGSALLFNTIYTGEDIRPAGNFLVNWTVIMYALSASLFFGLLSGVLPAWRMSRLHPVTALKGGEL